MSFLYQTGSVGFTQNFNYFYKKLFISLGKSYDQQMKHIYLTLLLIFFSSCSSLKSQSSKKNHESNLHSPEATEELVSLNSALNHIQASYLKGCVDALKKAKISFVFKACKDMSMLHRKEVEDFLKQEHSPSIPPPVKE